MKKLIHVSFFSSLFFIAACSKNIEVIETACTAEATPGLIIDFIDKKTGLPVSSCNLSVVISDGDYIEKLNQHVPYPYCKKAYRLSGALERGGTYSITIKSQIYADWNKQRVVVTTRGGLCNKVIPVHIHAYLE